MFLLTFSLPKCQNLTAGRSFPSWLSQDQRRKLSKDDDYNNHVMLLQDFSMPAASNLMRLTRDRKHLLVTGVYPPQTKCFQLDELSCKWSRHMEHETVAMEILTDDFAKIAYLGMDRWVSVMTLQFFFCVCVAICNLQMRCEVDISCQIW